MSLTFFLDGCEIFLWAGERRGSIFGKLTNENFTSREAKMMFWTLHSREPSIRTSQLFLSTVGRTTVRQKSNRFLQRLGSRTSFQDLNSSLQDHSIGAHTLAMVPSLPASHALLTPGLQDTMAL